MPNDNSFIYDPENHYLLNFDGEIVREGVVIRTMRQIDKFLEISNKEVDKLTPNQVAGLIRAKYGFQGVRMKETFPVFEGLNKLIDSMGDVQMPASCDSSRQTSSPSHSSTRLRRFAAAMFSRLSSVPRR